jgi:hypothetical protein
MILTFSKTKFEQLIKDGVKIHTIRRDEPNRWKVGNKIHFRIGNQCNTMGKDKPHQFGVGVVSRIETIEINPDNDYIIIDSVKFSSKIELDEIAINDGFENWEEMKSFFPNIFYGKIVFWKSDECFWFQERNLRP